MTSIAKTKWREVYSGAILGPWDQGASPREVVQPGVWNGCRIEIQYQLPRDFETRFNREMARGTEDEFLETLIVNIRLLEEDD